MKTYDLRETTHATSLIRDFGIYLGIAGLDLDEAGNCRLSFDEQILDLEYDPNRDDFLVQADVGEIASVVDAPMLRRLFELSLAGSLKGVGSLGLDGDRRQVVWLDRIAVTQTTQPQFQKQIERALDRIDYWKSAVRQHGSLGPAPAADVPDPDHFVMIRI